ncbi:SIR2 family protein [Salinibacter sp.]|uniref:SIR2 family protein n=1 Tax=Salinibacter sp. TaxID=2065818 RepID=UPI0021E6DE2D|nr:SIR2 family protein [Salinibacter sp.]
MTEEDLQARVKEIIDQTDAAPFLFVGTGMSKRYIDAESWENLLRWSASLTDESFSYYEQQAKRQSASDEDILSPRIGSLIDDAFNEIWWKEEKYTDERERLEEKDAIPESPLKLQVAKHMRDISQRTFPDEHEEEIQVLKDATIDGIITTNYDTILEDRLFPDYTAYTGQDEVIFAEQHAVAEIYKIHGSATDPDSLVLTREDYNTFENRNRYLAAKLITIFLEHPVILLGYSISDPNIQTVLYEIIRCLDKERLNTLGDRLIFVEYNRDESPPRVGPYSRQVGGRDLHLTRVIAHDYTPIFRALAERKRHLNAKLVRQVKEEMYDLVRTNDPQGQLHVLDIEDLDEYDDVEIVVGVGVREQLARRGLKGIEINELFEDLILNGDEFNALADEVVTVTIRDWLDDQRFRTPIYKYLSHGGLLDGDKCPVEEELQPRVLAVAQMPRERFEYSISESTKDEYRDRSVQEVIQEYEDDPIGACRYLTLVEDPDVDVIESFLRENSGLLSDQTGQGPFKQLSCIYDRMRYGPGFEVFEPE